MSDTETRVRRIVDGLRTEPEGEVPGDRNLFEAGILDSMATLQYVAELESCFAITIPNEELIPQNLWSIDATVSLVERHL